MPYLLSERDPLKFLPLLSHCFMHTFLTLFPYVQQLRGSNSSCKQVNVVSIRNYIPRQEDVWGCGGVHVYLLIFNLGTKYIL
jgi:hypothetical protein